jgi:hypothetical protein
MTCKYSIYALRFVYFFFVRALVGALSLASGALVLTVAGL